MLKKFQIGDIAYFQDDWSGFIEKCKIQELKECNGIACAEVKSIAAVDMEDNHIYNTYGTSTRALMDLYPSYKEAFAAHQKKEEENARKYREEIKNVGDLLVFPLRHCLNGEEYTDYVAKAVYKQRVKELLGLEFNDKDQIFVLPLNNPSEYISMDYINKITKEKAIQTIDKLIEECDLEER